MGFDMPDGARESANVLRNFLAADFLLAANPAMASMYEEAYRLRNVYGGRIIEEGYPRVDRQRLDAAAVSEVTGELERAGLPVRGRKLVLFAPTWRGATFSNAAVDTTHLLRQVMALQAGVGDEALVLLKAHQVVHAAASRDPELARILVPHSLPANRLLGIADGLVTDYSSIFFDYLATGRPIVFFAADAEEYDRERGTYLHDDRLPGPVHRDGLDAGAALRTMLQAPERSATYEDWARRFVPREDGQAARRVVDIVFGGITDGYRVHPARSDGRRRVLLSLGGMRANGITTSAISLLNALDHSRYDVTALMPFPRSGRVRSFQQQIHPDVRQVFRIGGMNGTKLRHVRRRFADLRETPPQPRARRWSTELWGDEWRRVLGSARFDWIGDFSGYSPLWANILLHSPPAPRAIWLHNDMAAERTKRVNGKQTKRRSLSSLFALYPAFQQLVSVSPALSAVNRDRFGELCDASAFVDLRNIPDLARVSAGVQEPLRGVLEQDEPAPVWLRRLRAKNAGERWFVSVGRLSPEKNHQRLIRAFAQVSSQDRRARLVIIGEGHLRADLEALIDREGLSEVAFLAGHLENPFGAMSSADCFVLSSDYEGQPMVLMEAALCGLPIISTSFSSVEDALPSASIRVVAQTDGALRDAMLAHLAGDIEPSHLDAAAYTSSVLADFDTLTGVGGQRPPHAGRVARASREQ
jgi:CDP-glycerol glycerophosphotransferase